MEVTLRANIYCLSATFLPVDILFTSSDLAKAEGISTLLVLYP